MSKPENTAPKPRKVNAEPTQPLTVHLALAAVMQDLKAIGKWNEMKQGEGGAKYAFRGIDDLLSGMHPIFAAHGIVVVPEILEFTHTFAAGQTKHNTSIHTAAVRVKYTIFGPLGDSISGSSIGVAFDTSDKATPKAMTMAYKSWLCQTFVVATYDTQDADSYDPTVNPRTPQGEDLTTLSAEALEARLEAIKTATGDTLSSGGDTTPLIAARNLLEDEQNRREAEAPKPEPTSQKVKSEKPAKAPKVEKAPAQRIPPANEAQAPVAAQETPDNWRTVKLGPECPVADYRGKTLGELPPENIKRLRDGWANNEKHMANIAVVPEKRELARHILSAYRELFPE